MHQPHANLRRLATTAAARAALIALSSCGNSDPASTENSPRRTPTEAVASPTEDAATSTDTEATPSSAPASTENAPATEPATSGESTAASGDVALAQTALLRAEDIGEGWQNYGPASAFPMKGELAASLPSCAPFVDVVFEGNTGAWAHTSLGRNMDIALTSVTVFASATEAAAMIAATAKPQFDKCWADFNEIAVVQLPFGIKSAKYESVEPPDVKLGGDSSSLHALVGTIELGSSSVPDTCVCAFVQRGRTVISFHSAAPVFSASERSDLIAAAVARVDETIASS